MDRNLLELMPGLKPWEIDQFTLPEIGFVLGGAGRGKSGPGGHVQSDEDIASELSWWHSLSPREKIQLKRAQ